MNYKKKKNKNLNKKFLFGSAIFLIGCNNDGSISIEPIDNIANENIPNNLNNESSFIINSINENFSGSEGVDNLFSSSQNLSSNSSLNGGDGVDNFFLNLRSDLKISPNVKNIENLIINSNGDYTLNLENFEDLEKISNENSNGGITLTNLTNPNVIFEFSGDNTNSLNLTNANLGGSNDILNLQCL